MKFTPAQDQAITITDRNLIVSAGAGAGKTATLVERVYRLLTAGTDPCTVDQLLIVTFTRTAAQEMKQRLAARLAADLAEELSPARRQHLEEQLFLLPRANISTIHSYCLELITSYPEAAGLTPGFELMAEGEARLYHQDFVREKLEQALAPDSPQREILLRMLGQLSPVGAQARLRGMLVQLQGFLSSLPEPEGFVAQCERLPDPDDPSARRPLLERYARAILAGLRNRLGAGTYGRGEGLNRLQPQYDHYRGLMRRIDEVLAAPALLEAAAVLVEDMSAPRVTGSKKNQTSADEEMQKQHCKLKDAVNKDRARIATLCGPEATDLMLESRECLLALVRDFGVAWLEELDASHMEMRRLTFHHLEKLALRLLEGPDGQGSEIARIQRQRFRYILIDEFQDVNEFQERILGHACRPPRDGKGGNLFVVGDVKQSIFAFRQADPTLFLEKYNAAAPLAPGVPEGADSRLDLAENFRSASHLLEEFNGLFRKLLRQGTIGLDYTAGQQFIPGRVDDPEKPPRCPPLFQLDLLPKQPEPETTDDDTDDVTEAAPQEEDREALLPEAEHVARLVESIGPPWKDIAILLRAARSNAPPLVEALERRGIPIYTDSRTGYLTAVEVIELQQLLRAIPNPFGDVPLLAMLRGPAGGWNENELLRLRFVNRGAPFFDNLCVAAGDGGHPLREKAASAVESIRRWQDMAARHTVAEFVAMLLDELHLLERASVRPGGDQRKRNLQQMVLHAGEFDGFRRKGLGEFLRYLDDLLEHQEDFAPPVPLPENADVVSIMTIHKSKGMQFPIVVTPFLGAQLNVLEARADSIWNRRLGLATKFRDSGEPQTGNTLLFDIIRDENSRNALSEELRLLYVALTRAKEAVYMTASARNLDDVLEYARNLARLQFPPLELLTAKTPLTWVLPHFLERLQLVDSDLEPGEWHDGPARLRYLSQPMEEDATAAAAGRDSTPPADWRQPYAEALERIRRLQAAPQRPRVRAKLSVSEAKRAFDAIRDGETPPYPRPVPVMAPAERPADADGRTGARAGTATHRFLANCDIGALSAGRVSLREELERLEREHLLAPEDVPLVLLDEVAAFFNGPLGKRMRIAIKDAWRELPFTVRLDACTFTGGAPSDFVILQGVADLLFREGDGWVLVDYKTDWCGKDGGRVQELVSGYTPQLQLYRLAVERTLREPVKETWLVFLRANKEVPIAPRGEEPFPWERIVEAGAVITPSEPVQRRVQLPREV